MTYAQGFSWGRQRTTSAFVALAVALTAFMAASPPPGLGSSRASGRFVRVIVRQMAHASNGPADAVERLGGEVGQPLAIIGGFAAKVPASALSALEHTPGVTSVTPDAPLHMAGGGAEGVVAPWKAENDRGSLYKVTQAIGADDVWGKSDSQGRKITGKGVGVALIDTGVVPVEGLSGAGKVVNGPDLSFESSTESLNHLDTFGHGTHMAGIIAGRDSAVPPGKERDAKQQFVGVAPDATLLNVKVASADGATDASQVIAAIDWVVQHRNDNGMNIRVLNLSFGTDSTQSYLYDPIAFAAEVAWRKGIVVVAAAGNEGLSTTTLTDPAIDPYVIAVGASDPNGRDDPKDSVVASFSSAGSPDTRRPDLVAPGRSIVSLRNPGSYIDQGHAEGLVAGDSPQRFFRGSGTSQATAVVSGAAALLLQQRPTLTPDQVKRLLTKSADPLKNGHTVAQGAGILDVKGAVEAPTPAFVQTYPTATGTGSLEAARGTSHVADPADGTELVGEQDIFGQAWDGRSWSEAAWEGRSWSGGTWNGRSWSGDDWTGTSWSGRSWSGRSWSDTNWTGRSWSGRSWSDNVWDGRSWSGRSWSDDAWSGRSWSGVSGRSWSTADWGSLSPPPHGSASRRPTFIPGSGLPMLSSRTPFALPDPMSRPEPPPLAPGPTSGRKFTASERVWCLTSALGALALCIVVLRVEHLPPLRTSLAIPWYVLAALFAATEVFVVHLQFRRDAHSFSLSEIPLLLGLAFTSPAGFVVARVLGAVSALLLHRRQSGVKLGFNIGHFFFEACLALIVYRAVLGHHDPASPWGWVAAFSATMLTDLVSALTISAAIWLYDRQLDRRLMVQVLVGGVLAAITNTSLALLAVIVLGVNVGAVWLLVVVAAILFLAYRTYSSLIQNYARTELLYGFTRAVGRSVQAESVMHAMLTQARDLLRTEMAEMTLFGTGDQPALRITLEGEELHEATDLRALDGPDGVEPWWQAAAAGEAVLVPRTGRNDRARQFAGLEIKDAMAVPLGGEAGVAGVMIVANRLGEVSTFDDDDLRLFGTLANHAGVALENGRLVDRLRQEVEQKEHQSLHDSLTGLPNRRLFHHCVNDVLGRSGGDGPTVAVMLMDLDRFKEINDTLGHEVGDLVLRDVGARLNRKLRGRGTIARLGGDEFAILLPDAISIDEALEEAHELLRALDAPFVTQELSIDVDASIGLALSPMHGTKAATLLQHADVAMYTAKHRQGGVEVYAPESDQHSRRRLSLASELREAVEARHLEMHYQPVVSMADGAVVGAEALARWEHSTHGWVAPDEFIPLAEHTSLIRPLTLFVLEEALAQAASWRKSGRTMSVSVNLSARSLLDLSLPQDIARLLLEFAVPASGLTLEITESSIMSDPGRTEAVLERLHLLGVGLSIDDFGTGYSSLSYLKRLPVDQVKIDKSFVINMAGDENDAAIVRSTIDLGHNLGLRVVAEGVEDHLAWDRLLAFGCDLAQGFLVSRPLPASVFNEWLAATDESGRVALPRRNVPMSTGAFS